MQSVNQASEIVSYITGTPRGRTNQIARALIDAGILPKSSGRDIKKISAGDLLPLLAAVAMAEKVADAPRVASEFVNLPVQGFPEEAANEGEPRKLPRLFSAVMDPDGVWEKAQIEFAKVDTGFTANIEGVLRGKDGERHEVLLPFWTNPSWGHFCKSSFTISPEGILNMRNLFARPDIEGMHFSMAPIQTGDE